jgi:hypothetical protein
MTRAAAWGARAVAPPVALLVALLVAAAAVLTACGASPKPLGPAGIDGLTIPTPAPAPTDFAGGARSNAWFPLEPGTRWVYRQYTPYGDRAVIATVLRGVRRIDGIPTTGVRWQVRVDHADRTAMVRWYAVDNDGNVWWFGQQVAPHDPPLDPLAPRSWEAGREGAEAGLILTATPRVGDGYFNARQPRVVERRSTVVSLIASVATTRRTIHNTVATSDLSSLAPLHTVQTYYGRGLGMVAQEDSASTSTSLSLVRMTPG